MYGPTPSVAKILRLTVSFADVLVVWEAAAQDEARTRANAAEDQKKAAAEIQKRREEIKRQAINGQ